MRIFKWLARFNGERQRPHYIRDYSRLVTALKGGHDRVRAMHEAVGGHYEALGAIEAALLKDLGLKDGQFVVDVGCGSGRLSSELARCAQIDYLGTDVVQELLDFAAESAPDHYHFERVTTLRIPCPDETADFVVFFSVMTHLMHHESYIYLEEAKRVAKPGGQIVISFLEFQGGKHWPIFDATVAATREGGLDHLNAFIEQPVWHLWAKRLGLQVEQITSGGTRSIKLDRKVTFDHGIQVSGMVDFGQSLVILRKP